MNNQGVVLLQANDYEAAVDKFADAINLDPSYQLARDNLAITYNNWGLNIKNEPKKSLSLFHKALLLCPYNETTRQNGWGIVRMMGRDPFKFSDRVSLGTEFLLDGNLLDAAAEFREALGLREDPEVHSMLEDVLRAIGNSFFLKEPFEIIPITRPKNEAPKEFMREIYHAPDVDTPQPTVTRIEPNPKATLRMLHRSLLRSFADSKIRERIDQIIIQQGKNPNSPKDRVALGDKALKDRDLIGAAAEYAEAIRLQEDPKVLKKLDAVYNQMEDKSACPRYEIAPSH